MSSCIFDFLHIGFSCFEILHQAHIVAPRSFCNDIACKIFDLFISPAKSNQIFLAPFCNGQRSFDEHGVNLISFFTSALHNGVIIGSLMWFFKHRILLASPGGTSLHNRSISYRHCTNRARFNPISTLSSLISLNSAALHAGRAFASCL